MRWIWIDRFTEFVPGQRAKAIKNLSWAEDYFRDHFPGYPIFPASLLLEGLAQTGGILAGQAGNFQQNVVLAKISMVQVHGEAYPGQQLEYEVELLDYRSEGATVRAIARSDGQLIAEAEIMFAHVRTDRAGSGENFVFTGDLKKLLGLNKLLPGEAVLGGPTE